MSNKSVKLLSREGEAQHPLSQTPVFVLTQVCTHAKGQGPPREVLLRASFTPPASPLGREPGPTGARRQNSGKAPWRLGNPSPGWTRALRQLSPSGRLKPGGKPGLQEEPASAAHLPTSTRVSSRYEAEMSSPGMSRRGAGPCTPSVPRRSGGLSFVMEPPALPRRHVATALCRGSSRACLRVTSRSSRGRKDENANSRSLS